MGEDGETVFSTTSAGSTGFFAASLEALDGSIATDTTNRSWRGDLGVGPPPPPPRLGPDGESGELH